MGARVLRVLRLPGLVNYARGLELQHAAEAAVGAGAAPDTLILLQALPPALLLFLHAAEQYFLQFVLCCCYTFQGCVRC